MNINYSVFLVPLALLGFLSGILEGSNTFPSSGNAGVGTMSPSEELEVRGDIRIHDSSYARLEWFNDSDAIDSSDYWIGEMHNNGDLKFMRRDSSAATWGNNLVLKANGNVGIGTTVPSEELEIYQSKNSKLTFRIKNINSGSYAETGIELQSNNVAGFGIHSYGTGTSGSLAGFPRAKSVFLRSYSGTPADRMVIGTGSDSPLHFITEDIFRATITKDGNFGIGTITPRTGCKTIGIGK